MIKSMNANMMIAMLRRVAAILTLTVIHVHAEPAPVLEKAEEEMAAWLETSLLLSREKTDWKAMRVTLQDRIALLESELAGLKQKTVAAQEEGSKTSEEINTLEQDKQSLIKTSDSLVQGVTSLESRVRDFLANVPGPIRERVRPLSQRLPADPSRVTASASERFQNVVGILNELGKFGREITLASEVRDVNGGGRVEVTAMYLGFGQAYFVNAEKGIAGVGQPGGAEGWVWSMEPGIATDVQQAIAIYRNELPAAYVRLPVRVRHMMAEEVNP